MGLVCASCGQGNQPGARFCGGCGTPLAPRCSACGEKSEPGARFCQACGASLVNPAAGDSVTRKIVTIVFADLIGSVALHERLDAENARRFMARYHQEMGAAVERHGGRVVQLLGDGVLAAFGVPRVAEDDAIRAVRSAVAMQTGFRELLREQAAAVGAVGLRVAVNTGEVIVSDDQTNVTGDPTNVAARLQQEARDGDVLIGEATERLVGERVTLESLGRFAIRGRVEPVSAYRVVSLEPSESGQSTAFVGREDELRRLRAVFDAAVAAPCPRIAVLLGSPGLGKSRLLGELTRRLRDRATVISVRCDAARGRTFEPLAVALRAQLALADGAGAEALGGAVDAVVSGSEAERARIASGVGALLAGAPPPPEETFFVVRRLLAGLAASRPVVLAIDDVQWAEPLLLDLAEHLVQWSSGVPLLILLGARPELREMRSALVTPGGVIAEVVTLGGLDASSAARLAANAIGAGELPAALMSRVLAASEGNPLFVGELARMLVHDGALRREGERWTTGVELARLEMPPTIHALLAARIERLGPEERAILERAAVIGRQFSRAALAHLLQRDPGELDARLESLRRSELIEPDSGWFLGEPALRFHHALIRDAAYRRVLRRTRADLHTRLADWIAARVGAAPAHDELIGWHLEQAHSHLRELGPLDAHGAALGVRAARHLGAAGRLALARDDLRPAADSLGRALECLAGDDPARADLALDWCEALLAAGEVVPATRAVAELGRFTSISERVRAWHTCFAAELAVQTDPQALRASAEAVAGASEALASAGDFAGEAKAHSVHATALARLGRIGASEAALDRALAAARRASDRRRANGVLSGAPVAALYGPSPVARASGRCLDVVRVLRITQDAPAVEAVALRCQAVLEALRGRTEAARRMIASARERVEELGITSQLLEVEFFAGYIELLDGDLEAAARFLSAAYEGLREQGLGIDAARAAALLARTRLAQGDAIGAEVLSQESEALAGDDLNAAIAWRGVRAEALARRGEHAAAVELARAAVEIALATDALLHHASARRALAAALRAAGRGAEADAEDAHAIELWEAKGATLLAERARREGVRVTVPSAPAPPSTAPRSHLRLRRNAATAHVARLDAALAARDEVAIADLSSRSWVGVNHATGVVYDWGRNFAGLQSLLRSGNAVVMTHTPIATLGESLALVQRSTSFAELEIDEAVRFGAVERDDFALVEVDAQELAQRIEFFAGYELGAAVTRLFERHAELLPQGAEAVRTAATARALAKMLGPADLERWASEFAPEIEFVDARSAGLGVLRGVDAVRHGMRGLFDRSVDFAVKTRAVLALRADALVVSWTSSGRRRDGDGAFERELCQLFAFGADGRLERWEQFEAGREAEALARFDALARPMRRLTPNAATAHMARFDAACAARDAAAVTAHCSDSWQGVHHASGAVYAWARALPDIQSLLQTERATLVHEPLASLGDSLALARRSLIAPELSLDAVTPFGSIERDDFVVSEVDAKGLASRAEFIDRLDDGIVRLYARYAERLLEGPERVRAAATARSLAACIGPLDLEAYRAALAPGFEFADHRLLGLGRTLGAPGLLAWLSSVFEVATDVGASVDDVIALRSDALLARRTISGAYRGTGGRFEQPSLRLWRFGVDGLLERLEWFDADRVEAALARFDELTSESRRSSAANA
ncbi:MAG: AAA family ATPase, partial [Myxococcota bacterium]